MVDHLGPDGTTFPLPRGELVGPSTMVSLNQVNFGARTFPTQNIRPAYNRSSVLARAVKGAPAVIEV